VIVDRCLGHGGEPRGLHQEILEIDGAFLADDGAGGGRAVSEGAKEERGDKKGKRFHEWKLARMGEKSKRF